MQTFLALLILAIAVVIAGRLSRVLTRWLGWVERGIVLALKAVPACLVALPMVLQPADVPSAWRPWTPVQLDQPLNPVARMKVRAMVLEPALCRAALSRAGAGARFLADAEDGPNCHIRNRVRLTGLSAARLSPVETRCEIAARLYLWERNVVQPAARRLLGTDVARVEHFSSFACRRMRTSSGTSSRWSQHATANAIDIAGFTLADGRRLSLVDDWNGSGAEAAFLRAARDGLCDWFNIVLSPDYNRLHADHFHADMGPFLTCR